MNSQKIIFIIIILLLLAGNIFFAVKYYVAEKRANEAGTALQSQKLNERVLNFAQMFVEKVLKSDAEIDFETRLQLENAIRGLGDQEILAQWEKLLASENEKDAQEEVKNLLFVLLAKVKVQ